MSNRSGSTKPALLDHSLRMAIIRFQSEATEVSNSKASRKSAAAELRRILCISGVYTLKQLITTEGQLSLIEALVKGKISDRSCNKTRSALHWILVTHGGTPLARFVPRGSQKIATLSPEVDAFVLRCWWHLQKDGSTSKDAKHFKTLWRHLVRRTGATTLEQLKTLKPSDYVLAFYEAEVRGESLKSFDFTKRLFRAVTILQEHDRDRWTFGSETFTDFADIVVRFQKQYPKQVYRQFDLHDFEYVFSSEGARWAQFDEVFRKTFAPVISAYGDKKRSFPNHPTEAGHYSSFQSYLNAQFYGPNGWAHKRDREFTESDRFSFARFVGIALQVTTPTRFFSELGPVVFSTKKPVFSSSSSSCIFYWTEKKTWALFINSTNRKNKVPSIQPYNDLVDAIISKYVGLFKLKDGYSFLQVGMEGIADELKRLSTIVVGSFNSVEDIQNGAPMRALTPHRFRSVFTKVIQFFYEGEDQGVLEAAALGEIPRLREGESRMSDVYGSVIRHSLMNFDKLRRIKNGIYRSDLQIRFDELKVQNDKQVELLKQLETLALEHYGVTQDTKAAVSQIGSDLLVKNDELREQNFKFKEVLLRLQADDPEAFIDLTIPPKLTIPSGES